MSRSLPLLIVGAGPFGLAMSRYAHLHDIDHRIVGRPMSFWREHMPEGMYLRSGTSWHLDPANELTFEPWMEARGLSREEVRPLSLDRYLDYVDWYRDRAGIEVEDARVEELDLPTGDGAAPDTIGGGIRARLEDGSVIAVRNVLLALGFAYFVNEPTELVERIPEERRTHTAHLVDLSPFRGKRVLIVGGRQSAFETAALLCDAGAEKVWISHRHRSPEIAPSDWSWVEAMVERMVEEPDWYRRLPDAERAAIDQRFWREGRLKVEPWLGPRLDPEVVTSLPSTEVVGSSIASDGSLEVALAPSLQAPVDAGPAGNRGDTTRPRETDLRVDQVILATGYDVDLGRVPFLEPELLARLELEDGFPPLDDGFQGRVPGLFITSMAATRDFGAFLAFTVSVRAATRVAGRAIAARIDVEGRASRTLTRP